MLGFSDQTGPLNKLEEMFFQCPGNVLEEFLQNLQQGEGRGKRNKERFSNKSKTVYSSHFVFSLSFLCLLHLKELVK